MGKYNATDGVTNNIILTDIIEGFPYPQRNCRFCNGKLDTVNAIHLPEHQEIYKAVLMCFNYLLHETKQYYTRIYYSCDEAEKLYEPIFLRFPVKV